MKNCIICNFGTKLSRHLVEKWYQPKFSPWLYPLLPFSYLYRAIFTLNRWLYQWKIKKTWRLSKPIIVIGNLTLGGSGKTPTVIALAQYLSAQGRKVGVITRGYKADLPQPRKVSPQDTAKTVGDEAVLMAQNISGPVVACRKRHLAAHYLCEQENVDVILSDDGLQHHALARNLEICLIDAHRQFGNAHCLPAGPLREPLSRLKTVSATLSPQMHLLGFYSVKTGAPIEIDRLRQARLSAIAGIGNPPQFFKFLINLGLTLTKTEAFPDHYAFEAHDLQKFDQTLLLMTEKDAVKCRNFASEDCYFLKVGAELPEKIKELVLCASSPWS